MTPEEKRYDEFRIGLRRAKMHGNSDLADRLYKEYMEKTLNFQRAKEEKRKQNG